MPQFNTVANDQAIADAAEALAANGFHVTIAENANAAKTDALAALPKGAEVLTVTSQTLAKLELDKAINDSGDYDAVRPKLNALMGQPEKQREQRKLGAAPDYVIGSVHAVTQDGHVLIASATGSQLPAYLYGAGHVVWVVGAQKIVKDLAEAETRLTEYVFPLEDARALKAYGGHSSINKVVHYMKEATPNRIDIILVKEALGF